jgi:hypothetical protein
MVSEWEQPEIPGAAEWAEAPLEWDEPEFGFGRLGWGDWAPERGEVRPAGGNYEGVGNDNPYCS